MMFTTHILVGAVLGYALSFIIAIDIISLVLAGMIGGLLPELDFLAGKHRRTLHYPFTYFIAGLVASFIFMISGVNAILLLSVSLVSAGLHSFMDIFAGAELRSWDPEEWKDTAVYDHLRQRWIRPRRLAYGGSLRDLMVSLSCAVFLIYQLTVLWMEAIIGSLLVFSLIYSLAIRWFSEQFVGDYSTLNQYIRSKIKIKTIKGD